MPGRSTALLFLARRHNPAGDDIEGMRAVVVRFVDVIKVEAVQESIGLLRGLKYKESAAEMTIFVIKTCERRLGGPPEAEVEDGIDDDVSDKVWVALSDEEGEKEGLEASDVEAVVDAEDELESGKAEIEEGRKIEVPKQRKEVEKAGEKSQSDVFEDLKAAAVAAGEYGNGKQSYYNLWEEAGKLVRLAAPRTARKPLQPRQQQQPQPQPQPQGQQPLQAQQSSQPLRQQHQQSLQQQRPQHAAHKTAASKRKRTVPEEHNKENADPNRAEGPLLTFIVHL
jgi:hypothetical protein